MATVTHVLFGPGIPSDLPPAVGAHYIDTTKKTTWLAVSDSEWRLQSTVLIAAGDPSGHSGDASAGMLFVSTEDSTAMFLALGTHLGFVTLPGFEVGASAPGAPGETFTRLHFNPTTGRLSVNSGSAWYHVDLTEST